MRRPTRAQRAEISIHPPREGWDLVNRSTIIPPSLFQSTHPARGGTLMGCAAQQGSGDFNPPTPRGVGPA